MTVWAEEQGDAGKLAKWQRMPQPGRPGDSAGATGPATASAQGLASGPGCQSAAAEALSNGRRCGSDYLVPWHVPSHRPEAAAVAAAASNNVQSGGGHDRGFAGGTTHDAAHGDAGGIIDAQKGTVVFQRYYHLFCKGELEQLAAPLPGVGGLRTFFDKDNWCLVMERM